MSVRLLATLALLGFCGGCERRLLTEDDFTREGSYSVPGIERLEHKPIAELTEDNPAPTVTLYEDGLFLVGGGDDIRQGHAEGAVGLARWVATQIVDLPRSFALTTGSDQPNTTIRVRIGSAWRSVNVNGYFPTKVGVYSLSGSHQKPSV